MNSGDDSAHEPSQKRTRFDHRGKDSTAGKGAKQSTSDHDMGAALRTVYQKTVDEVIPSELLDLLGKLD